ncbi:50S ribosomal protein L35 [Thermogemmatispora sp.]|uniref:50S ribosomal protein L35 n=1 Tax=Thermogemmatispora sp. TaxID=1968838 RepID=UPI001DBD6148|nr:50S ribosomal protein L35 [Thermogemmatispora sp.]MBX5448843.1 50S ribosomal protein L35 [Thermogemmatispora sp.]
MKQKLKTHKATAKRIKITATGKLLRRKVAISHLRRNKSSRSIRAADKTFALARGDARHVRRLLPYAGR